MNTLDTPIDLSLTDLNGRETYRRNTANCYIVRNEGTFQIPLVYGNAIKDNQINTESFYTAGIATDFQDSYGVPFNAWSSPFIKDHASAQGKSIVSAELLWNDGKSKIINLSVDENFLTFDVKSFSPCNALVAIKDNDGTILWSWHLWLTNEDLTPKVITNADGIDFKVMPCNLGWNGWTPDGKPTSPYYQWGRKDPFIANEKTSVTGSILFESVKGIQNQFISHQNLKTFYTCVKSLSWTSDEHPYFWDSKMNGYAVDRKVTKTIYDPCPIGWSIPQYDTFTALSADNTKVADNGRYCTTKDGSQDLFIPFSGYRDCGAGSIYGVGNFGSCWLSTPFSKCSGQQLFLSKSGLDPQNSHSRSNGFSVRPALTE